jgi:hypothetical protein
MKPVKEFPPLDEPLTWALGVAVAFTLVVLSGFWPMGFAS